MKTHTIDLASRSVNVIRNSDNEIVRKCYSVTDAIKFCKRNGFEYNLFY